ncbi:hypothetical protein ACS0TY_034708 [Phlomoides rotata]
MWPGDDHQNCTSSNGPSSPLTTFPSIAPPPPPHNHHCVATLEGQNSYTSALLLTGECLFTGSSDGEIRLNSLTSLHHYQTLTVAGKGAVKALIASSDKLITAHQDHKIRVWKLDQTVHNHHHQITHLATLPTLTDRAIKILIPKNHIQIRRHKTRTWIHHVDTVSDLALSIDESLLYSVSWDRALKIWRTSDFKCLESVPAHDDAINAMALSRNGRVYTGSTDRKIKIWRKKPGEKGHTLEATLEKHNAGINALALSADGTVLYSGGSDRLIVVWMSDERGGGMEVAAVLRGHKKAILCLSTESEVVCSGSADKTVRIWARVGKSCSCLAVLEGHKGPIKCIKMAIDHDHDRHHNCSNSSTYRLYSASLDCDIKIWKVFLPG